MLPKTHSGLSRNRFSFQQQQKTWTERKYSWVSGKKGTGRCYKRFSYIFIKVCWPHARTVGGKWVENSGKRTTPNTECAVAVLHHFWGYGEPNKGNKKHTGTSGHLYYIVIYAYVCVSPYKCASLYALSVWPPPEPYLCACHFCGIYDVAHYFCFYVLRVLDPRASKGSEGRSPHTQNYENT